MAIFQKNRLEWNLKVSENMIQYVTAACNGDTDAMAKLYSKTLKGSYFLAATLCDSIAEAADITKRAYAKAFCTIAKLKRPEAFEIWMKQNVSAVYKDGRKFVFDDADGAAVENSSEFLSESILEDAEKCEKIYAAVKSLKPELRTAIVLHYNNGMPVPALAKFLSVSESTANALLGKARAALLSSAELEAAADENPGALPVLTRIFQRKAVETAIDNSVVRDIFIFAIDAYEASKPVAPEVPAEAEKKPEPVKEEVPAKTEESEAKEEPKAEVKDNVISFKQKINEILDGENIKSEADIKAEKTADEEGPAIPGFTPVSSSVSDSVKSFGGISIDDEPAQTPAPAYKTPEKPKFDIKNLNKKTIGIIAAALVVLIIVIVAIAKAAGGDKPSTNDRTNDSNISQNADEAMANVAYKWVAGGFEECSEIVYLNETYCKFKSVTTGKYGLMEYQGNVVLQPNYDDFQRCGSGKDYTSNNNYHIVVVIEGEKYGITTTNGEITVETTVHGTHQMDEYVGLGNTSYDERDRYFEGYAAARKDGKWGYVSQDKDKKVINYEYEAVNELDSTEAIFSDYCRPVTGGLIAVKKDGVMGIIDLEGEEVVPFEYSNIMPGSNGVFIACKNGTWGVILTGNAKNSFAGVNITVEPVLPTNQDVQVSTELGKYVVVDEDGVNIRSDAGIEYDLVGSLDYGDKVDGYAKKEAENGNEWLCIKYDGEYAWVAMSKLEKVSE